MPFLASRVPAWERKGQARDHGREFAVRKKYVLLFSFLSPNSINSVSIHVVCDIEFPLTSTWKLH